jgi:hypothetical protein
MRMSASLLRGVLSLLVPVLVVVSAAAHQDSSPRPAVPHDPIAAILDAFRTHNVVALGEPHGNEQGHAFRVSLIRDPRFAATVNDIVWECGNARYQDVMDRFVRGEDVAVRALRQVFQNTIGSIGVACDLPIYEGLIREVRAVNTRLPRERQLRVLLGDPPIDWTQVHRFEDALKWAEGRDVHAVDVIRREVLAKNRRALVIYGGAHLMRKSMRSNYERDDLGPLVDRLGDEPTARIFAIWADTATDLAKIQPDVASWRAPKIAHLRGTALGAADFMVYWTAGGGGTSRFAIRNGRREDIPKDQWRSRRMDEQFDALLYLGPPSTMTQVRLSPEFCADAAYMAMRLKRMALVGQPTDQLKQYCAAVSAK